MARHSAGILMYRLRDGGPEVLLVHPGGPFWARKDEGAWSIPKGEFDPLREDALAAAKRELLEETGCVVEGECVPLPPLKQKSGKTIAVWAVEADWDPALLRSNTFTLEWPPRSGQTKEFPEADRAAWFTLDAAMKKLVPGQAGCVTALAALLDHPLASEADTEIS